MSKNSKIHPGYIIPTTSNYIFHTNSTYYHFLNLAKGLKPGAETLTDCEAASQLQDLHYLIKENFIRIQEFKSEKGEIALFLEISQDKAALALPQTEINQ